MRLMSSSRQPNDVHAASRAAGRFVRRVRNVPIRAAVVAARVPVFRRLLTRFDGIGVDHHDPVFRANPYPTYHRLRERGGVRWSVFGAWMIPAYEAGVT